MGSSPADQATVEDGRIKLPPEAGLPEHTRVRVVVEVEEPRTFRVMSPRLVAARRLQIFAWKSLRSLPMPEYDRDRFDPPAPVARVRVRNPETGHMVEDTILALNGWVDVLIGKLRSMYPLISSWWSLL